MKTFVFFLLLKKPPAIQNVKKIYQNIVMPIENSKPINIQMLKNEILYSKCKSNIV